MVGQEIDAARWFFTWTSQSRSWKPGILPPQSQQHWQQWAVLPGWALHCWPERPDVKLIASKWQAGVTNSSIPSVKLCRHQSPGQEGSESMSLHSLFCMWMNTNALCGWIPMLSWYQYKARHTSAGWQTFGEVRLDLQHVHIGWLRGQTACRK